MEKLKASKVAEWFLENWIYKYGLPVAVVVYGGPELGQDLQQALTKAGTTIKVTTPYYPEANGMIERGNQPLKDALVKLCETEGKKWRHYLPLVLFADRISTKRTTGYSPYELVFGRSAILPVDLELETYLGTDWTKIQSTEELLLARTEQLERREEVIQTAYRKMKEARAKSLEPQNNKKSIRKPLEPGSLVLAYSKSLASQWGKLFANRWNGPYQIEAQEKGGSYFLKELDGSILKRRFAASQIKPFYARKELSGGCISRKKN